ncbi:preprotein translocase subunit SecA [Hafnia alvei]|uniref:Preprotein translocase subunit SecA n=1 Tax=Hafnia alvei TaxID=569 RepID=A0A377PPG2_HAFAL|nr:preprotein translocase subunit SecA [Hafnia alvei]
MEEGESLYSPANIMLMHHVNRRHCVHMCCLRVTLTISLKMVKLSSSMSTPAVPCKGRRWSDGLHQAVEAKEGVEIQNEKPNAGFYHLPELLPSV